MRKYLLLFIVSFFCFPLSGLFAQQLNSAEILQGMEKLNTVGSVLYIAAHPDDENTRLLAYLSGGMKLRTGYLSLTRGDGGQNLIGKEQGEALGLLRTEELLAARRIDGAEQFFTRAIDFGFSKNPDETFGFWNKDSVLADVVWVIRKFRPDIIIMRFPTTGEGGHGHHTASAILAVEAFDAAADPTRFPEQLDYVTTWQAKRLFWNTFNFGEINMTSPDQMTIDVGGFNPLLGLSYGEIAAISRSMHKSQGFGSAKNRGSAIEYFKLIKGEPCSTGLFEGIDISWNRISGGAEISNSIEEIIKSFDANSPQSSVPKLIQLYSKLLPLDDSQNWKQLKLEETRELILACAGIWLEANTADYSAVPGDTIGLTYEVICRNIDGVRLVRVDLTGANDPGPDRMLEKNVLYKTRQTIKIDGSADYTNPYWLNDHHSQGLYSVNDRMKLSMPESEPGAIAGFVLEIENFTFPVIQTVHYKYTDPVKGEIYRPFEVLPPVTVNPSEKVYVFGDTKPKHITLRIKANTQNITGKVEATVTGGWNVEIQKPEFTLQNKGEEIMVELTAKPDENAPAGKLELSVNIGGVNYNKSIRRIEYDHIPYQFILSDAEVKLVKVDLRKPAGRNNIGYIQGAGDDVPASLKQIGYNVTVLTDDMLLNDDLAKYDAIVSGVRAYNVNERLQVHYNRLMDYVNQGGNLIVQYNTNNRIGPVVAKIGPYPFNISRDRVTNENAEVKFINPGSEVLNEPNKITSADFDGWIQERGIYFASELDPKYETVLSMNDPGEGAKSGSLIIAKYGKGNFVYTGLVFFRELPAGVPGAYRLFVNLLSLPIEK